MRVLILANFGMGLYNFRKEIIESLLERNHEVIISYPHDEYVPKFIELGCKFINTDVDRRGMNPIKDVFLFVQYSKNIKKVKPDVVLTYTIKPNIYGGLACQLTNTKYISTITGLGSAIENKGFLRTVTLSLYRLALRTARSVFFQNEKNKKIFEDERILKGEGQIISGSGVNLSQFNYEPYPESSNTVELVYVGRIMRDKGMNELLAAIPLIKAKYSHVNFSLIGFCEEEYESQLRILEKQGLLIYQGKQNDVRPYIRQAHAIVLPSYHEGMSNVLLEAAATGRPILASNIPGCRETFDDNISGIGFDSKDTDSLIEAIEKFINLTHEEKAKMGYFGRQKIEQQFDRNIVVSKYINEIEKVGK